MNDALMFGPEAGPANPTFSHAQQQPAERRPAAVGPAGAGDIRAQRGAGALGVLAQTQTGEGPIGESAAAAPGLVGDTADVAAAAVAPALAAAVHFTAGIAEPGFGSAPGSTGAVLAGAARTGGPAPAQQGSRSWLGGLEAPSAAPPNATSTNALGGPVGRL